MTSKEEIGRISDLALERQYRWNRAAAWAREQSFGPWSMGLPEFECRAIEALRDRILEIGEEAAEDEYFDSPPERHLRAVDG